MRWHAAGGAGGQRRHHRWQRLELTATGSLKSTALRDQPQRRISPMSAA